MNYMTEVGKKMWLLGIISSLVLPCLAQTFHRIDTLPQPVGTAHTFLNIEIPSGETFFKSSGHCGTSLYQLSSLDSMSRYEVFSETDPHGNFLATVRMRQPDKQQSNRSLTAAPNFRITEKLTELDTYSEPDAFVSEFNPDPSTSTDLYVDLGVGATRMDLSGMTLHNVSVNSAFSDVTIAYSSPNQMEMEEMDIHVASADVILKNIEQAKAKLVTVRNDMGETKIILGAGQKPGSTIFVQSGVGNCVLVLDKDHPVELVLKTGFFSKVDLPESYTKASKGIFHNPSKSTTRTKIICNLDFGNVSVMEQ
ncbi:MAG: hypothetical protein AAF206_28110 [Bacteroidota bacterium]